MSEETKEIRWWLHAMNMGRPTLLEVTHIDGEPVENGDEEPTVGPDSVLTVDRAVYMQISPSPNGQVMCTFSEARMQMGIFLGSEDLNKPENRRPVKFFCRALMGGPFVWLDITSPGEQQLKDVIKKQYTPESDQIVTPERQGRIIRPGQAPAAPGAQDAFAQLRKPR